MKIISLSDCTHLREIVAGFALLALATSADAMDTYTPGNHELSIATVVTGNASYSNLVVTVGTIVSGPNGTAPQASQDTYNPINNQLTVPAVAVGANSYFNVVATISGVNSIGGVTGADIYNPANGQLNIPYVQIGSTVYENAVVTVANIISVKNGMPQNIRDQYDVMSRQLSIPGVLDLGNNQVYTNVVITVGQVLSVGGSIGSSGGGGGSSGGGTTGNYPQAIVTAIVDPSSLPVTYYSPTLIDVSVSPVLSAFVPSGTVTVTMGGNPCTATLGEDGTGSCIVPASPVGTQVRFSLGYSGDSNFKSTVGSGAVDVGRAPTQVALTIPEPNLVGNSVGFTATVSPELPITAPGSLSPSGIVEILDSNDLVLCQLTLDSSGSGSCSSVFSAPLTETITARYSGDGNYLPGGNSSSLVVTGTAYWTGSITCSSISMPSTAGGDCYDILYPPLGAGGYSDPLTLQQFSIAILSDGSYSYRIDYNFGPELVCNGGSGSSISTFTLPVNLNAVWGYSDQGNPTASTITFATTSQTNSQISGTFSDSFPYVEYDDKTYATGTASGTWSVSPTTQSFNQCSVPANATACISTGVALVETSNGTNPVEQCSY